MKRLVVFFSASGTTKAVAEELSNILGATLFEIVPEIPYSDEDLDWRDSNSRSSLEMKDALSRPAIANYLEDISQYDEIYLGFPIWWYRAPYIINTFLEHYDFNGKKIILFATSGGSGFGKTVNYLRPSVSKSTEIIEGEVFSSYSKERLVAFANSFKKRG